MQSGVLARISSRQRSAISGRPLNERTFNFTAYFQLYLTLKQKLHDFPMRHLTQLSVCLLDEVDLVRIAHKLTFVSRKLLM